jgi:methyl-accepting chemotaxis protein
MRAEGKALLQEIREQRKAYVAAFTQVGKLLGSGQREAAQNALRSDMLPKLTALQETIRRLNDRQRSLVTEHGAEIEHNIRVATSSWPGWDWPPGLWCLCCLARDALDHRAHRRGRRRSGSCRQRRSDPPYQHEHTDEMGQLLTALRQMTDNLSDIVGRVRGGTTAIRTASSEIASGNMDLSSRTEEQASSLEETAASMEELTSTVKHNAGHAIQANELARGQRSGAPRRRSGGPGGRHHELD